MSLNFSFNRTDISEDELWWTYTDQFGREVTGLRPEWAAVVWAAAVVDIGHIVDEAVAAEFFMRYQLYKAVNGPVYRDGTGDDPITMDVLTRCIGLSTNVATLSRVKWFDRLMRFEAADPTVKRRAKVS